MFYALLKSKLKDFGRVQKGAKIDPKPWTIVHGFGRIWTIFKTPIFMLDFA